MGMPPERLFNTEQPVGQGRRYPHDCSNKVDKSLIITRTTKGWVWHCHRCKEGGVRDLSGKSPAEKAAFIRSLDVKPVKTVADMQLPHDYTRDIPPEGLLYLYRRGLKDSEIKRWKIGYSPRYDRIIFPVYDGHKLVFYEGRTLGKIDKDNPKYMKVYQSNARDTYFVARTIFSSEVVVVEDIVSAIRVSRVVDAYALLSTHVLDSLILQLCQKYDRIYLWLDPDKRSKCVGLMRRYQALSIPVHLIFSDKDPKFYSDEEIGGYVYGKNNE